MKPLIVNSVLSTLLLLAVASCGPGDPPEGFGEQEHRDIEIGSTEAGGGPLVLHYESEHPVEVAFSECLGGTGALCSGGILLYTAEDPGFSAVEAVEPSIPLHPLPRGSLTRLVVSAADPGASLFLLGTMLDEPGDSVALPAAPEIHLHGVWQLAWRGGSLPEGVFALTLRLESDDGKFLPSGDLRIELKARANRPA